MTWDFYNTGEEFILKEKTVAKNLLDTLSPKEKKLLKKMSIVNLRSIRNFLRR